MTVVTRPDRVDEFQRLPWLEAVSVVAGGTERSDSVRAGLERANAKVVLIHDGARPLVSSRLVDAVAQAALEHGAAIPLIPVSDSLKRVEEDSSAASVDRAGLFRAQTPQGARRELLVRAFEQAGSTTYTDEASLLEAAGIRVTAVDGEATNIKVTDPSDLQLARAMARGLADERVGYGEDVHPFGPADGLLLGGVSIPDAPRLHGHSDGDVVLHALATAVLSAAGLGDLGRLFPASDGATEGISSAKLLASAAAKAEEAGWMVDRAQVSIVGARPHIGGPRLDEMRQASARLMGVAEEAAVSVTASTGNLTGPEGAGLAIRATALVTLVRR